MSILKFVNTKLHVHANRKVDRCRGCIILLSPLNSHDNCLNILSSLSLSPQASDSLYKFYVSIYVCGIVLA